MKRSTEKYDVVVCGGGLAGFSAAVAAARHGATTCLIQDRPVFGGNSSSEIGVTPHGAAAFHAYARETGIISELLIEERWRNHAEIYENGWTNSVWDLVMYDMAESTPGLKVFLNTSVKGVVCDKQYDPQPAGEASLELGYYHRPTLNTDGPAHLSAVVVEVLNAEHQITINGKTFIDCTGDGLVGDHAGCEWRMGSESRNEFDEPHAPEHASTDTMGNSIHFRCRDVGRPVPYQAPEWAVKHEDASYFYDQGRIPKEERGGFWWLEIGVPYHTIHDNEEIRHELTRHALGVWHWMKNHDPVMKERTKNYALDWIGQVPGKRESRRLIGEYFVTEHDVLNCTKFEDEIAFGGWFIDLHTPGGLLAASSEPSSTGEQEYDTFADYAVKSYCGPYGIPLRCLIAKDVDNLMMAGRNVSTSHAALGTIRVMGTTALLGQACGVAAAYGLQNGLPLKELASGKAIQSIKQSLLRDGCFLPNQTNQDALDLAREATITASSSATVEGAGPETTGAHDGLAIWRDQPQYSQEKLVQRKGQLIAVGTEGIKSISVCLSNASAEEQQVKALLYSVSDVWDYRTEPSQPLAVGMLKVPSGEDQWIEWQLDIPQSSLPSTGSFVRIDLQENPQLSWRVAGCVVPGHVGTYQIGPSKMRRFSNGSTLSYRISPPQSSFPPEMVNTGVTRPHGQTNLWRSAPDNALPQWVELSWDSPREIQQVEITFPGHLLREYHAYAPYYVDPQCVADYQIEAFIEGQWAKVTEVKDNYQRQRLHPLKQIVVTDKLRITATRTNGDPSAAIYEVRCYGPS